jgi:hypothetical protein
VLPRRQYWIHLRDGCSVALVRNGENHGPMALPDL